MPLAVMVKNGPVLLEYCLAVATLVHDHRLHLQGKSLWAAQENFVRLSTGELPGETVP
jgi:hypothetical protein